MGKETSIDQPRFTAIERSKIYLSVVDQIVNRIKSGEFPPGAALPPERSLATQFEVSRGSLREALRVLEHAGVLDPRPGSGTYVASSGGTPQSLLRARAEVSGEHSPLDLLVARAVIEPACAENAALYHRAHDLDAIRAAYETQRDRTGAGLDASAADAQFHLAIAAATQNSVLRAIEEMLVSVMHEDLWSDLKGRSRSHAGAEYLEHHRLILRAIEQRDPRRASQVMAMHISAIETSMIAEIED